MRNREMPAAVGGSSLLVIFAVLCLTVFALLSLSTVQADGRLALASSEAVENYYKADSRAEEILSELRRGIVPLEVKKEGNYYSYRCEISAVQALEVEVQIDGEEYQILRWQVVSVADWEQKEEKQLWDGTID